MVLGIGIDIIEIARIQRLLQRNDAFAARVLAPEEQRSFHSDKRYAEYVAGRFAAKEAASKAFGTGIGQQVGLHDLVIHNDERGAPVLTLRGAAAELAAQRGVQRVHLSISHSDSYAVAQVLLEGESLPAAATCT